MMGVPFVKMHGIGNDFIVIDGFRYVVENPAGFARSACRRRISVGADGVIFVMQQRWQRGRNVRQRNSLRREICP